MCTTLHQLSKLIFNIFNFNLHTLCFKIICKSRVLCQSGSKGWGEKVPFIFQKDFLLKLEKMKKIYNFTRCDVNFCQHGRRPEVNQAVVDGVSRSRLKSRTAFEKASRS